jgi:formylglycine-generating enzyme required for sulfatase activity
MRDPDARDDEQPQHMLYLPDYSLSKTPVTNIQYTAFVQAKGCSPPRHWTQGRPPLGKEGHPMVYVSWHDALAYCRWLSEVTGKQYSLPSEAQWEKGARGTDGRIYPWGDQWEARRYNSREGGLGDTTPVWANPQGASPYGLLNMAGNVWEWTCSLWGSDMGQPDFRYPYNPGDGREDLVAVPEVARVLRGGAFGNVSWRVRCAYRHRHYPINQDVDIGFRVVVRP